MNYYTAANVSFANNVPDPDTSGKELPTFKFALEKSEGRVIGKSAALAHKYRLSSQEPHSIHKGGENGEWIRRISQFRKR